VAQQRPEDLADFLKPPVDEVAVAIQFPAIEGLSNDQLREFWKTVRTEYPFVESQARLDVPLEESNIGVFSFQFQMTNQPQNVRLWLIAESDDFLIQVQDTRFIQNWRRRSGEYPHFEHIRDDFWQNFGKFREFLTKAGLPQPRIEQIEVTYINWIPDLPIQQFLRPASETAINVAASAIEAEQQTWSGSYLVPSALVPVERLYAQASPALRSLDPKLPGTQFTLMVRGANSAGIEAIDAERMIDESRDLIVRAFADLTTTGAHEIWARFK
jgi:uncharacterized protein (TIGR04255 family)